MGEERMIKKVLTCLMYNNSNPRKGEAELALSPFLLLYQKGSVVQTQSLTVLMELWVRCVMAWPTWCRQPRKLSTVYVHKRMHSEFQLANFPKHFWNAVKL